MKKIIKTMYLLLIIVHSLLLFGCGSGGNGEEDAKKVATPVITPDSGIFKDSKIVTMSCETEGALIRYTLDGTTPSETSSYYNSEITIKTTTTIKAKAYKDGMYSSDVKTALITITTLDDSEPTLQSISVKTLPTKLNYVVGDTFDITGLVVEGTYSDGSKKTETVTTTNITGFNSTTTGTKTVTVTLSGKTVTFNVTINNAITTATFTLKRKIDLMEINEYSASFEVYDSRIAKLLFSGAKDINPKEVAISDKKGSLASFMISWNETTVIITAVDALGNKIGDTKTVTFTK